MYDRCTTRHVSGTCCYMYAGSGVTPDTEKVKAVKKWPTPHNASEVRQFLGLAFYYCRFIHDFAYVAAPLHNLTQNDVAFCWSNGCNIAFQTLKDKLVGAPILGVPSSGQESKSISPPNRC